MEYGTPWSFKEQMQMQKKKKTMVFTMVHGVQNRIFMFLQAT